MAQVEQDREKVGRKLFVNETSRWFVFDEEVREKKMNSRIVEDSEGAERS
jgi:hypothetical protein